MIVPTRRFWFLVALGIPLALAGIWVDGIEPLVLLYNLIIFSGLILGRVMTPPARNLRLSRVFDDVLSVNARNTIELVIENVGAGALVGELLDECPQDFQSTSRKFKLKLESGERQVLSYDVKPRERGSDFFPATFLRLKTPLGLSEVHHKIESVQPVEVYPNIKAIQSFDLLNQKGRLALMGVRRTRYRGQGTEFESLREYSDDDFRRIDWKSTARRGKLVVRDYEVERNQAVFIAIDIGRHMLSEADGRLKLDHVLDTALLMMHAADRAGDQVGLLVFAERVVKFVPPRRGKAHINMLLEAIHDLRALPVESNVQGAMQYFASRWKRRALVVLFTDVEEERESKRLTQAIKPLRMRHLWFLVRVMDPRLKQLGHAPIASEEAMYDAGAYEWYMKRREDARVALSQSGLRQIEAEPEDLAGALVNAYWQVKQSGAI